MVVGSYRSPATQVILQTTFALYKHIIVSLKPDEIVIQLHMKSVNILYGLQ